MMSHDELCLAFQEAVKIYQPGENPRVSIGDKTTTLDGVTWHLRQSETVMPDEICDRLTDMPRGSTYAQGARHMKLAMRREEASLAG